MGEAERFSLHSLLLWADVRTSCAVVGCSWCHCAEGSYLWLCHLSRVWSRLRSDPEVPAHPLCKTNGVFSMLIMLIRSVPQCYLLVRSIHLHLISPNILDLSQGAGADSGSATKSLQATCVTVCFVCRLQGNPAADNDRPAEVPLGKTRRFGGLLPVAE